LAGIEEVAGKRKFSKVAVGGTFDELHRGHRKLLLKAFKIGDTVFIGLTSDNMLKDHSKKHAVDPYESRKNELLHFLSSRRLLNRATIIPLNDKYGTTLDNGNLEAIVVSEETQPVAQEINHLREKKGLKPLVIFIVKMVDAEDSIPISSTRIRIGEIDREGHLKDLK
jgi:pantetheine-phosphate adenylyltransferase